MEAQYVEENLKRISEYTYINSNLFWVDPNLSSITIPKQRGEDSFSAERFSFDQETVKLCLYINHKYPLFRLGFSELYKIWLISEISHWGLK